MRVKKIDGEEEGTELTEDEIKALSQGFHVILVHVHVIILVHVHIIILVHVHVHTFVSSYYLVYISSCTCDMTRVYKYACTCIHISI